jgi:hypothetical protein
MMVQDPDEGFAVTKRFGLLKSIRNEKKSASTRREER